MINHSPPAEQIEQHNFSVIDTQRRSALINHLGEHPLYAEDAPITSFVKERVHLLCNPDETPPEVYVRNSPEVNACRIGNSIIIDRGMIELFSYTEELDAILAHEYIHHHHDHNNQGADLLEQIGKTRPHEIEADIRGMMHLDKKGINPRGFVSALEKLADHEESTKDKWAKITSIDSPTHGNTRERAVNLEQAAWLLDMPHLSPAELTPLSISTDQFGKNQTPNTLGEDPVRRQSFIKRKITTFQKNDILDDEAREDLINDQEELFRSIAPELSDDQIKRYSKQAIDYFHSLVVTEIYSTEQLVKNKPITPQKLYNVRQYFFQDRYSDSESIAQFIKDSTTPAFKKLIGQFNHITYTALVDTLVYSSVDNPSQEEVERTVRLLKELDHITASRTIDIQPIQEGIANALGRKARAPKFTESTRSALFTIAEALDVSSDNISGIELIYDIPLGALSGPFDRRLLKTILSQQDPIDFLAKLPNQEHYNQDTYDDTERPIDITGHETWFYDLNKMFETAGYSDEEKEHFMARLKTIATDNSSSLIKKLEERTDLSEQEKEKIVQTFIYVRHNVGERSRRKMLDHLSLVYASETRYFIDEVDTIFKSADEFSFGDFNEIIKLIQRAVLKKDASDPQKSRELLSLILKESTIAQNSALVTGLESLIIHNDAQLLATLVEHTTPRLLVNNSSAVATALGTLNLDEKDNSRKEASSSSSFKLWEKAAEALLSRSELFEDETLLKALVAVGIASSNIEVNLTVPGQALARIIERYDFSAGLQMLFNNYRHLPAYVKEAALDYLVEHKARSLEEFNTLELVMTSHLEGVVENHAALLGAASITESTLVGLHQSHSYTRESGVNYDEAEKLNNTNLLHALLLSGQDDESLKRHVFRYWWLTNRLAEESDNFFNVESSLLTLRHPHKQKQLEQWINEVPNMEDFAPFHETLKHLYISDARLRFVAIRKLMLGQEGVLATDDGRRMLIEGFMSSWLKDDDPQKEAVLRNVLSSLLVSENPERIYQYVGPVLQDLILKPSKSPFQPNQLADEKAGEIIQRLLDRGKTNKLFGNEHNTLTKKITHLMNGTTEEIVNVESPVVEQLKALFNKEESDEVNQISTTELALLTGKKSGALGVRMLQLAGQYYEIPEEERPRFNEVYDSMKGQTRLQAAKVIQREAQKYEVMARIVDNIDNFGSRLGGGSLMTVYEVTMRDGNKRVLGVRNPNAEYHVTRIAETMQKTFEIALQNDPNNTDLQLMNSLLLDAAEWISKELNDTEFVQKDPIFRQENDTQVGTGFKKGKSRYDLHVPEAYDTGTPWIRHEEYVDGVNINNLKIVDSPSSIADKTISKEDFKDVTSLLIRNTIHQLQNGKFVHSDVHGGNFRVTTDNKRVAVFDRYNLIPVGDDLRHAFKNTIQSMATGDTRSAIASIISTLPQAKSIDINEVTESLARNLSAQADISKGLANVVVQLKKSGITMPVELSLIIRNIFSINQLAQKAGFKNLVDGFAYTATDDEINSLLS